MPARVRTRWINPRRRWATYLIAVGVAVVVFIGGAATGFGIAHHDRPGLDRFHAWMDRGDTTAPERMPRAGMGQHRGPGMQQFPGDGQRPGWRGGAGGQDDGTGGSRPAPSSSPSTSTSRAPSTAPPSSAG
jgi:hypothetical protein